MAIHSFPMTPKEQVHFQILRAIEQNPEISQRDLAHLQAQRLTSRSNHLGLGSVVNPRMMFFGLVLAATSLVVAPEVEARPDPVATGQISSRFLDVTDSSVKRSPNSETARSADRHGSRFKKHSSYSAARTLIADPSPSWTHTSPDQSESSRLSTALADLSNFAPAMDADSTIEADKPTTTGVYSQGLASSPHDFSSEQLAQVGGTVGMGAEGSDPKRPAPDSLPKVAVAKWLGDARSAISFEWDDTNEQHYNLIGPMFDKYAFHTSFAVITSQLLSYPKHVAGYKSLVDGGHELCSHTHTHLRLNSAGMLEKTIRYELSTSKQAIGSLFGKIPKCFVHPGNAPNKGSDLAAEYYLWSRIDNPHQDPENFVANVTSKTNLARFMYTYSLNSSSKNWVTFAGHGVDGGSYEPISSKDLDAFLSFLKSQSVWVDTVSNVALYNEIRRLVSIKRISDHSIDVDISKLDFAKYGAFGIFSIPITILVSSGNQLEFSSPNIWDVKPRNGEYVVTVDIARSSQIKWSFSGR